LIHGLFFNFVAKQISSLLWVEMLCLSCDRVWVLKTDALFVWTAVRNGFVGCFLRDNNRASDF